MGGVKYEEVNYQDFRKVEFDNGDVYEGEIKNNLMNGQGTWTSADGDQYVGEWKAGNKHGHGTYTFASGTQYVGEFEDGNFHGQGTFTSADGDQYVGEFKNDKMLNGEAQSLTLESKEPKVAEPKKKIASFPILLGVAVALITFIFVLLIDSLG